MDSKRFWIVLAVVVLGLVGAFIYSGKEKDSANSSGKSSSNYYGKLDSPVTITEFVDFQCEACYSYYPSVKQAKEQFKDKVKFQVRYFPISSSHQFSIAAARSAEAAARQGKFWEMHDRLFEGQKMWEQTPNAQTTFDQYAQEIGLDMTKFKADRESTDVMSVINKDLDDVKKLGGTGTPTFAINGKKVENPGTGEALTKMIEDAIAANEKKQ